MTGPAGGEGVGGTPGGGSEREGAPKTQKKAKPQGGGGGPIWWKGWWKNEAAFVALVAAFPLSGAAMRRWLALLYQPLAGRSSTSASTETGGATGRETGGNT